MHGISDEELVLGPSFPQAFTRMTEFVDALLLISVQSDDSSDEDVLPLRFRESPPDVVSVAHNGHKFDFPFLLSECHRNCVSWDVRSYSVSSAA